MKYLKLFENNEDDEDLFLIEDFLLEYAEKWKLADYEKWKTMSREERDEYKGIIQVEKKSATYFKVTGFPTGKSGYRVKISFNKEFNEKEFKEDMLKIIKRVCLSGYEFETYKDVYGGGATNLTGIETFYIAFFK